jgi:aerobic-type carbon monoxide dehydrogenase small subunit (CoxS/CutS family)
MSMVKLDVNGKQYELDVDPDTPLLWVLRDHLNLTGTKYGCGIGQCGACTVHINGRTIRSCSTPVKGVQQFDIVTIEGLSGGKDADEMSLHPVQQAWIDEDVPQCGYCQSGQILTAAALIEEKTHPTDDDINAAMINLCRCGTYQRIRKAIHSAAQAMNPE